MLLSGLTLREYLTGFALHATPEIKLYKYQVSTCTSFFIFSLRFFFLKNQKKDKNPTKNIYIFSLEHHFSQTTLVY